MNDDDDLDVGLVILEHPKTEIYWNANGHLVITQEDQLGNDDGLVIISPFVIPGLIRCLHAKWRDYEEAHPSVESIAVPRSAGPPQQDNLERAQ